ncbi:MAG: hypothetical protein VKM92_07545 [Cyanobacteriota bacterium]|nr:hypothetical protein [Cyanobacteriota bacterium]
MQRTYLALATLAAGAALSAPQGLALRANTISTRAPLGQIQQAGQAQTQAALQAAAASLPPPPPLQSAPSEVVGIVALEVVPYRP